MLSSGSLAVVRVVLFYYQEGPTSPWLFEWAEQTKSPVLLGWNALSTSTTMDATSFILLASILSRKDFANTKISRPKFFKSGLFYFSFSFYFPLCKCFSHLFPFFWFVWFPCVDPFPFTLLSGFSFSCLMVEALKNLHASVVHRHTGCQ